MIFEMILNLKFAIAVGLYWSTDRSFWVLGISAMMFELYPSNIQLVVKNCKTVAMASSLMMFQ